MPAKRAARSSTWTARRPERLLMTLSIPAIGAGYLVILLIKLSNAPVADPRELIPAGMFLASLALVHGAFLLMRFRGDTLLAPIALFLAGLGLLVRHRMGVHDLHDPTRLANYTFPLGVAALLLTVAAFRNGRWRHLEALALPCAAAAAAVPALIVLTGQRYRGAFYLAGSMNPSEIVKVLLAIFLAGFLARRRDAFARALGGLPALPPGAALSLLAAWGLPMAFFILQRDFGMLVLLNTMLIAVLFAATGRWGYPLLGILLLAAGGWLLLETLPHVQQRVMAWRDPFGDPTGRSWQILQGLSALYSGGFWGTGIGAGFPHTIPIASSDFIYAALGEEIGFAGCGVVLIFFGALIQRGLGVAWRASTPFGFLLAAALVIGLATQTLLNVGGVVKAIPVTGITLPFISHGGSSLLTSFIALGLLLAISEDPPAGRPAGKPARRPRAKPGAK